MWSLIGIVCFVLYFYSNVREILILQKIVIRSFNGFHYEDLKFECVFFFFAVSFITRR